MATQVTYDPRTGAERYHWCTPSIVPDRHRHTDPYAKTLAPSYRSLGVPRQRTGDVHDVERFAAAIHESDRCLLSAYDPGVAHAVVLGMLARRRPGGLVLVSDTVRASAITTLEAAGLTYRFLPGDPYDRRFGIVRPPRAEDVLAGLVRYPGAAAVLYTSPTPEGLAADTATIAEAVHARSPDALVVVDETWGGHFVFHPALPGSAMRSGADVCVQSPHQTAGCTRQSALVHWREERVAAPDLERAYREHSPAAPGRLLLDSVEAATRCLARYGKGMLDDCLDRAESLRSRLRERLPGLDVLTGPALDPAKTVVGLAGRRFSGVEVAARLARHRVFVEQAGLGSVVLTATSRLPPSAIDHTVNAFGTILRTGSLPECLEPALGRLTAA